MDISNFIDLNQKVEITVWDEAGDDDGLTFSSAVKDINNATILVEPPPQEEEKLYKLLRPGITVGMVIVYGLSRSVVVYPTLGLLQTKKPIGYWLKLPDTFQEEILRKRNHVRVPIELRVKVYYQSLKGTQVCEAQTVDVSGGGTRLTADVPFRLEQVLEIEVQFPGMPEDEFIRLKGSVVYANTNATPQGALSKYIAAVNFQEISPKDEQTVMSYCFKRELELAKEERI